MSLLGVDIGTTNCKGGLFSPDGLCLARATREYPILRPKPGWVEFDSNLVVAAVFDVISNLTRSGRLAADPVRAISISALGEAMTPVSRDRTVIGNAIHHTDSRGKSELDVFLEGISREDLYAINPNIASPAYSLAKLLWWRGNRPELYRKADKFLCFGDLVFYLMGCEPVTSFSQANRTLLFDLNSESWSTELLEMAGIDRDRLPRPVPSGHIAGTVRASVAETLGLDNGVVCVVGGHDQCCNALGVGIYRAGRAVDGIGTVECITPVFSGVPDRQLMFRAGLHIEHHVVPDHYVTFIYNQAGSLVKWFRDTFAKNECAPAGMDQYDLLVAEMPSRPSRLLVLPHFEPTGAPGYIDSSSGVILGLKTATSRGEILKAIMECETFYFLDAMLALSDLGIDSSRYLASGGGAKSSAWLQIKADIMGVPIERGADPEAGVLGAAIIAGVAMGEYRSYEAACLNFLRPGVVFEPNLANRDIYREQFAKYRQIYPRLRELLLIE